MYKTPIYQRFESKAPEGVVAEASQIFDENLKKDQETINRETREGLDFIGSPDLYDMCKAGINPRNLGFMVSSFAHDEVTPSETYGERDFAMAWYPYLIDCSQNEGPTTPARELMANNWLRYADTGEYAPVVGITPTQAEDEDRELKPWETTSQNYSIGLGRREDVWILDGVTGISGKCWRGIFSKPVIWDGIDTTPYKLARTAIAPGPCTTLGKKDQDRYIRSFFYAYEGTEHYLDLNPGFNGVNDIVTAFNEVGKSYSQRSDCNQVTNMQWARNNNADTTSPVPCAEGGFFALEAFILSMELAYGTKDLHNKNLFGGGVSSNDIINASNYETRGGIKVTAPDGKLYGYYQFSQVIPFYLDESKSRTSFVIFLTNYGSVFACLEPNMAAAFIQEFADGAEDTEVEMYGHTYTLKRVGDYNDPNSVRIYSKRNLHLNVFDGAGDPIEVDVEINLCQPLVNGWDGWGNIWTYDGGGYEKIVQPIDGASYYSKVNIWIQPDQTKWPYETEITKTQPKHIFQCEHPELGYIYLGGYEMNQASNYDGERLNFSDWKLTNSGSLHTEECRHVYTNLLRSSEKRRLQCLRRGGSINNHCSPRSFHLVNTVNTSMYYGCSACWLIS